MAGGVAQSQCTLLQVTVKGAGTRTSRRRRNRHGSIAYRKVYGTCALDSHGRQTPQASIGFRQPVGFVTNVTRIYSTSRKVLVAV